MKRFPFPKDQEVGNTLYTQRNTQKQEHTGKKLWAAGIQGSRRTQWDPKNFNLLCRETGREVRPSDSKATTGPKNISLTSIEHMRERQNKYQNYNGENNKWAEIYKAQMSWKEMTVSVTELCVWSVSWLWNPLCPTSNGHKTFTAAGSFKKQVKKLFHLQSPCCQPCHHLLVHAHFHLGHWLCPPPFLTKPTPCSPLLLAWLFTVLPPATGDTFFLSTFPAKEIQLQHRTTLLSNHRPSTAEQIKR